MSLYQVFRKIKKILKKLLPKKIFLFYHYCLAILGSIFYGFPGKKMIVIGITGTKGKSSTANFIWSCLFVAGHKTGLISTANIRINEKEFLNKRQMTMPGRCVIQKLMAQMVKQGCEYCVAEITSEGIKQYRHLGLYIDIVIFTNLSPEHIESHGSFEKYKQAKGEIFKTLSHYKNYKKINNKKIEKIIIANNDNEYADYFLNFSSDKKITFGFQEKADYVAKEIRETNSGTEFQVLGKKFKLNILGKFNVYNALPAIIISHLIGIKDDLIAKGLRELKMIPGRMEIINEGQNFTVIVDYAHEAQSITNVLQTANNIKSIGAKTIILLGAEGGGRDRAKRPIIGEIASKNADFIVISNVDPYESDPKQILEDIAVSVEKFGKIREKDLFVIEDRRQGIRKALSLAQEKDIVLITSKGADQSINLNGEYLPWDDRVIVKEELNKMYNNVRKY